MNFFEKVKDFIYDMDLQIVQEEPKEQLFVVDEPDKGIKNLCIACEYPVLVLEQLIFKFNDGIRQNAGDLLEVLKLNRSLVHGAYAVDETGHNLVFRDTLRLDSLDFNEFEATINALSLGLAEHGEGLLKIAHGH